MSNIVKLREEPTPQNSVLREEQVAPVKMIYCKISTLPKLFNISKATAYRFLKEAEEMEEFRGRICTDVSATLTLVHIDTFSEFLRNKHKKYL